MRWPIAVLFLPHLVAGSIIPVISAAQDGDSGELPVSWSAKSRNGLYDITLRPADAKIEIGAYQSWIARITLPDETPVYPARISIGGGMQQHGHGLPTQPEVIAYGGHGDYLIEGVRFNMEGAWRLSVFVESPHGNDRADVEIEVAF